VTSYTASTQFEAIDKYGTLHIIHMTSHLLLIDGK